MTRKKTATKKLTSHRRKRPPKQSLVHRYGVIALLTLSIVLQLFGARQPSPNQVLAYATSISVAGLQSAQNSKRAANGVAALTLNAQLNSAAQAKANDMIARNYWSHNTPDGNPPWVFISNAGYSYFKAGENLAYGFGTSEGVVNGWMNSSSHRANVLDTAYKDVGFGVANGANYQGGENTVVVAMYGQPATVTTPAPAPTPTPTPSPVAPKTTTPAPAAPAPAPAPTPTPTPSPVAPESEQQTNQSDTNDDKASESSEDKDEKDKPFTTALSTGSQPPSSRSSRLRSILTGTAHWTAYTAFVSTVIAGGWFALKHTVAFKRVIVDGEEYVLTHPAFEVSLLSAAMLLLFVGTSGVIR